MKVDWNCVKRLPTDYTDYGGEVERWADGDDYPDCSSGCKHWIAIDNDWGVCNNANAPRAGLLTWEHQAGKGCFEYGEEEYDAAMQEMMDDWKWDNN